MYSNDDDLYDDDYSDDIEDNLVQKRGFQGRDVKIHPGKQIFLKLSEFFTIRKNPILDWYKSKLWFFEQDIALISLKSFHIGIRRNVNPICLPYGLKYKNTKLKFIGEKILICFLATVQ